VIVCLRSNWTRRPDTQHRVGLVEQAVISKSTKARGLSIVNTDAMNVGTRYMTQILPLENVNYSHDLERSSMPGEAFSQSPRGY